MNMMQSFRVVAALILLCVGARAGDIAPEVLQKLKNATAFVTLTSGLGPASGSSFLIGKQASTGYLVTSAHVVAPSGLVVSNLKVTFFSGTPDEFELPVEAVSVGKDIDLAILKVTSAKLPDPITLDRAASVIETTPVIILGFPFGKDLSLTEKAPSVTVAKGSISSIRKDEAGRIKVIQIDGNLNPGNSGGPVLSNDGALVGVSTATVLGTQIGLTIPKSEILDLLYGKLCDIVYEVVGGEGKTLKIRVDLAFVDPLGRIKTADILMALKSKVATPPARDSAGQWPKLAPADISRSMPVQSGKASVTLAIPIANDQDEYYVQVLLNVGGRGTYSEPKVWDLGTDWSLAERKLSLGKLSSTASNNWLAQPEDKKDGAAPKVGSVTTPNLSVAEAARIIVDASVIPISIKGDLVSFAMWSREGESVYLLTSEGDLHQVAVPSLVESRVFSIGRTCSDLGLSREGLLVIDSVAQKLLVLDERTLAIKADIDTGGRTGLAASPNSSQVFIGQGQELAQVDLQKRKVVAEYQPNLLMQKYGNRIIKHPGGVTLSEFGIPRMTPDGQYLFCVGFECLHRFRIKGQELVYEEMGPRIGSGRRIEISDDGAYVALPSGGGNSAFKGQQGAPPYSTFVFATGNLQKPVTVVAGGHYPRCLAFDKPRKCIYAANYDTSLIQFAPGGAKLKSYAIAPRGEETQQILPHPLGRGVLLYTMSKKLFWCQFDEGARAGSLPGGEGGAGSQAIALWKSDARLYSQMLTNAPDPLVTGLSKKLPELPNNAVPAYGGVYIIMQFKELGKLGVFNIAQAKFDKYIPVDDPEVLYATGGNLLLIYSPKEKMFHKWNLATLEKIESKACSLSSEITEMAMAMECAGLAVISQADTGDVLGKREYAILDTSSLKVIPLSTEERFRNVHTRDTVQIRVDPRFTGMTLWATSCSPSGFTYGAIRGQTVRLATEHVSYGAMNLSGDGKRIYCTAGVIVDLQGKVLQTMANSILVPIYGSEAFLEVNGSKANIRDPVSMVVLRTLNLPCELKPESYTKTRLTDDRKVFACAPLKRMVVINGADSTAHVLALGESKTVPASADTGVPRGSHWVKKLTFPAGSKISVEDGPKGMIYDAGTQSLVLDIPKDAPLGEIKILLSVTSPGKAEEFITIPVTIR